MSKLCPTADQHLTNTFSTLLEAELLFVAGNRRSNDLANESKQANNAAATVVREAAGIAHKFAPKQQQPSEHRKQ